MSGFGLHSAAAQFKSNFDWWTLAGVDQLIDDVPTPWLARGKAKPAPPKPSMPVPVAVPETLDDLVDWLNTDQSLPQAGPPDRRIAASGNPAADLVIVVDMPELEDHRAGYLISGGAEEIFTNMLKGMKLDRTSCYIIAMCPGRPAGGVLPESAVPRLAEMTKKLIALTPATRLWMMGQTVSRAILGMDMAEARGSLQNFNHGGVNKAAIVTFSPRVLLQKPDRKRAAWDDMQRLISGEPTE